MRGVAAKRSSSRWPKSTCGTRAERSGARATLLFFDPNGFKAINDRDGHAQGNLARTTFTALVMSSREPGGDALVRRLRAERADFDANRHPTIGSPLAAANRQTYVDKRHARAACVGDALRE